MPASRDAWQLATGSCDAGVITLTSGSITLSGATLAGAQSCTFSVSVTGVANGDYTNTVSANANGTGFGPTSTATLHVGPVPTTKSIVPTP